MIVHTGSGRRNPAPPRPFWKVLAAALCGAALVLGSSPSWVQAQNAGSNLEPLQKELAGLAVEAAKASEQANQAKQQADTAKKELDQARAALNQAKAPPPPNAAPQDLARRDAVIAEKTQQVQQAQTQVTQRTLEYARLENDRRDRLSRVEQFQRANPSVRLPDNHPLLPQLRSHGITLNSKTALEQAQKALELLKQGKDPGPVYDGSRDRPPVVDLRPGGTPFFNQLQGQVLAKKLEVDRLASNVNNSLSKIQQQESTVRFRKLEWDSAEGAYRRYVDQARQERAPLQSDIDAHNRDLNQYKGEAANHKPDRDAYERQVAVFNQESAAFDAEVRSHNQDAAAQRQDAAAQRQAVSYFNSLPAQQRSQAEANRLNSWCAQVNSWRDRVNSRKAALDQRAAAFNSRRQSLLSWQSTVNQRAARLNERARGLDSRAQQLNQRNKDLIASHGKTLLDLRLKASQKERAYSTANQALQQMQRDLQGQQSAYNLAVSQARQLEQSLQR